MNHEPRIRNTKENPRNIIIHDSLFMIRKAEGFTLIELLVVIIIIGLLTGLLAVNFVGVRQRTRDGARKSDIRQIQSALELYRSDEGSYPATVPACNTAFVSGSITYMQKIPCDPSTSSSYSYSSPGLGDTYCIRACLENTRDADRDELPAKYNANNPSIAGCTLSSCSVNTKSFTLENP